MRGPLSGVLHPRTYRLNRGPKSRTRAQDGASARHSNTNRQEEEYAEVSEFRPNLVNVIIASMHALRRCLLKERDYNITWMVGIVFLAHGIPSSWVIIASMLALDEAERFIHD